MPENQKEPFYRDHEGQDHLKPQVIKVEKNKIQIGRRDPTHLFEFGIDFLFDLFILFVFVNRLWSDWGMRQYTAKHYRIYTQIQITKV